MRETGHAEEPLPPFKIVPVIPTRGLIFARTLISLYHNGLGNPIIINGQPIPTSHNLAVGQAMDAGASHILFVEDDMELPDGAVAAMVAKMAPVVAIDYPVINGWSTIGPNKSHCGLGCTLIDVAVFRAIEPPWFIADKELGVDGTIYNTPYKYGGHDIWFGRKLAEAGYEITVLDEFEAKHLRCDNLERIEYNNGTYPIRELPPISNRQE